jgi:S-(hydroxymethyl)glutathione dehydrogenase/alcohol dehydrogenase
MALCAKRGTVVVTNIHPFLETEVKMSMTDLTLMEKRVVGSIFGSANMRYDIPKLCELYRQGQLDLDGMVTRTYGLEDVNQGYQDLRDANNVRGVLVY